MTYIDAHAHLLSDEYGKDLEKEISLIEKNNLMLVNNIGYSIKSSKEAVRLAEIYPFLFATVGVHPYNINGFNDDSLNTIREFSKNNKVLAIGEIGLDYFRDITDFTLQKKIFLKQLQLAKELKLPFMIHSRNAFSDTISVIKEVNYFNGIFHSFDYGIAEMEQVINLGLFVSFSGMLTFKKKDTLREAAMYAPLDRVLFETDSPYLAPAPMRGKRNTPVFVKYIYGKFSSMRSIDMEKLCVKTTNNFKNLFVKSTDYIDKVRRQYV